MKTKILIASLLVLTSLAGTAQTINFAVEKNNLFFSDSSVAGRNSDNSIDNRGEINVFAGFVAGTSKTSFDQGISSYLSNGDLSGLNSTLDLISWSSVPQGAGLLANTRDFNLAGATGNFGDSALLLVTTSSTFNNLGSTDEVGLVSSSTLVPELGTITIGFDQTASWDIAYLGTLGSLTLQAVPEPSSFALIAGCFGLALAVVRRRSRCA